MYMFINMCTGSPEAHYYETSTGQGWGSNADTLFVQTTVWYLMFTRFVSLTCVHEETTISNFKNSIVLCELCCLLHEVVTLCTCLHNELEQL